MILDPSDFDDRPYRIPNQEESRDFIEFIEKSEEELLINLFGYQFYSELISGLETSGTIDPIYLNIRDGGEYTSGGKTYKYKGLVYTLVPAVYSMWIDQNAYKFTNIGYVTNNAPQQATTIDNEPFVVGAWNDYVNRVGKTCAYSSTWNRSNTLYSFYQANKSDYENLKFNPPEYRNRFGF